MLMTMLSSALTGCAPTVFNAGIAETIVDTESFPTERQKTGDATWIDGNGVRTDKVTISEAIFGKDAEEIMKKHDISHISPPEEDTEWMVFSVNSSYDGEMPVKVMNEDGSVLSKFGVNYKGECYYLGDDYYCCAVPRGLKAFAISAGTFRTIVENKENIEEVMPETVEKEKETEN